MQRDLKAIVDGAIGGAAATMGMSVVMLAAQKMGLMGEQPPKKITQKALHVTDTPVHDAQKQDFLAAVLHFGFGISMGSLFGLVDRQPPPAPVALCDGIVFGTLVWTASYQGWIPALGIMPPPRHDRPGRPASMLVAHWVYGAILGAIVGSRQ